MRMLHFFGVLFLALAVLSAIASKAHAEGTPQPVTRCGDRVVWIATGDNSVVPDGADAAVAWAYGQVSRVANLHVAQSRDGSRSVEWQWEHRLAGAGWVTPGGPAQQETSLLGHKRWVHHLDGDHSESTNVLRAQVVTGVLLDLGVQHPTSTAAGLSAVDRRAVHRICAHEAAATRIATHPSPSPGSAGTPAASAAVTTATPPATGGTSARRLAPGPVRAIAWGVAIVLAVALAGWYARPASCIRAARIVLNRIRPARAEGAAQ